MKRGISELISYVLLLGLAIALGILVINWFKDQATTTITEIEATTETEMLCADVSLNGAINTDCSTGDLNISNRGYHKIDSIKVRSRINTNSNLISTNYNVNLNPGESQSLNINPSVEQIDILPLIKLNDKLVVCTDRKVTIQC